RGCRAKVADEQAGADEENERERHLGDDERTTHSRARAACCCFSLQRRNERGPRRLESGHEPEEHSSQKRNGEGEEEHGAVEPKVGIDRDINREADAVDECDHAPSDDETGGAGNEREHEAFGEKLPNESSTAGAKAEANGHLAAA